MNPVWITLPHSIHFELNENIPGQIEEAISNGWKSFSILPNGEVVNAETHMKVTLGKILRHI